MCLDQETAFDTDRECFGPHCLSFLIYDQRQHYQEEFSLIGFENDTVFQSQVHSKDKKVSLNQSNQIKLLYHHYTIHKYNSELKYWVHHPPTLQSCNNDSIFIYIYI